MFILFFASTIEMFKFRNFFFYFQKPFPLIVITFPPISTWISLKLLFSKLTFSYFKSVWTWVLSFSYLAWSFSFKQLSPLTDLWSALATHTSTWASQALVASWIATAEQLWKERKMPFLQWPNGEQSWSAGSLRLRWRWERLLGSSDTPGVNGKGLGCCASMCKLFATQGYLIERILRAKIYLLSCLPCCGATSAWKKETLLPHLHKSSWRGCLFLIYIKMLYKLVVALGGVVWPTCGIPF